VRAARLAASPEAGHLKQRSHRAGEDLESGRYWTSWGLVRKSLVLLEENADGARYRLLETCASMDGKLARRGGGKLRRIWLVSGLAKQAIRLCLALNSKVAGAAGQEHDN